MILLRLTGRVALAGGPVFNPGERAYFHDALAQSLLDDGLAVLDTLPVPTVTTALDGPPRATIVTRAHAVRKHTGGP